MERQLLEIASPIGVVSREINGRFDSSTLSTLLQALLLQAYLQQALHDRAPK